MRLENERCKQETLSDKNTSGFGRAVKLVLVVLVIAFFLYAMFRIMGSSTGFWIS